MEAAISQILEVLGNSVPQRSARFYAIKLFEQDSLVEAELDLSQFQRKEIEDIIRITEEIFTEDAESIVINERYAFIERVCQMAESHTEDFALTLSDKIDRIVTNRILALPIFAVVMYLVYFLSIRPLEPCGQTGLMMSSLVSIFLIWYLLVLIISSSGLA